MLPVHPLRQDPPINGPGGSIGEVHYEGHRSIGLIGGWLRFWPAPQPLEHCPESFTGILSTVQLLG